MRGAAWRSGYRLSLLAALSSTVITIGMVLPTVFGLALIAWGWVRLARPEPAIKTGRCAELSSYVYAQFSRQPLFLKH